MALGALGELLGRGTLWAQLLCAEPAVLGVAAVLAFASAAPLLAGEEEGDEVFGPFTPRAEAVNGAHRMRATGLPGLRAKAPHARATVWPCHQQKPDAS